jgi:hypothetical protein
LIAFSAYGNRAVSTKGGLKSSSNSTKFTEG